MANTNNNKSLNVPILRFPEFTDEWKRSSLGEVTTFVKERIGADKLTRNNYVSTENMNPDFGGINQASSVPNNTNVIHYQKGDVLLSNIRPYLRKVWAASSDGGCSADVFVFRAKSISSSFLHYIMANDTFINYVMSGAKGVKMPRGDKEQILKYIFSTPNIEEQNKISHLLHLLDERISTQNKIIGDLKKLKSAIIHRCYSSQTNMIPLSELLKQCSDRNRSGSDLQVLSVSNKYGFIAQSNQFEDREVASDDTSNYKVVKKGMFAYNPARINVGSIALYEMDGNGIVSPMYVCFTTKSELLPSYLKYYFASQTFKHEMYKRLEGSVRLCLTFEELCNIEIHLPSIEQQKNISKYISKIENNLSLVDSIFSKYQQQRRYLLSQMFI